MIQCSVQLIGWFWLFFTKLSGDHILALSRAALNTQKRSWGLLKKSCFFQRTPYHCFLFPPCHCCCIHCLPHTTPKWTQFCPLGGNISWHVVSWCWVIILSPTYIIPEFQIIGNSDSKYFSTSNHFFRCFSEGKFWISGIRSKKFQFRTS